jgi:hypothetical protein
MNQPNPWRTALLEKLTVSLLVKNVPTFYETRMFITGFKTVRHLSHVLLSYFLKISFNITLPSTLSSECLWNIDLLQTTSIVQHEVTDRTNVRVRTVIFPAEGSDVRGSARTFTCSAETTISGILLLHLRFSQQHQVLSACVRGAWQDTTVHIQKCTLLSPRGAAYQYIHWDSSLAKGYQT